MTFHHSQKVQGWFFSKFIICFVFLFGASVSPASASMVAMFDNVNGECPDGWQLTEKAQGRLIKGTIDSNRVGKVSGTPLKAGQALGRHQHVYKTSVDGVGVRGMVAEIGTFFSTNKSAAGKNNRPSSSGITGESEGNVPYMQLLTCEEKEKTSSKMANIMPAQMVSFFNSKECPADWSLYKNLDGRFVVPASADIQSGDFYALVGNLKQHVHTLDVGFTGGPEKVKFDLGNTKVAPPAEGVFNLLKANHEWMDANTIPSTSTEFGYAEGLPVIELLPCIKDRGRGRFSQWPDNLLAFMAAENCPHNWQEKSGSHGRYLLGLPNSEYAKSGATYGNPLSNKEMPRHTHSYSASFLFEARAFTGTYAQNHAGFVKPDHKTLSGNTVAADYDMPYVQLRHCATIPKIQRRNGGIKQ